MKTHDDVRDYIRHIADVSNGQEEAEFVFFWGGIYSQWAPSPITYDRMEFRTAEHFMMYSKAAYFGDTQRADMILDSRDPSLAKKIGREVADFTDEEWDKVKFEVVVLGNVLKFTQNPEFYSEMYLDANKIIVEASPLDRVWGIGRDQNDPKIKDVDYWDGQNLLGYAIMEARKRILGFEDVVSALT